jgi:hypothetical protein
MSDLSTLYHFAAVPRTRMAGCARRPLSELYNKLEWPIRAMKKRAIEFGEIIARIVSDIREVAIASFVLCRARVLFPR